VKTRKKFWLLPIILVLVLLGSLIVLTQGSAVAPFKVRQRRSRIAQRLNVQRRVRFASSLAAALLDDLFAHPG